MEESSDSAAEGPVVSLKQKRQVSAHNLSEETLEMEKVKRSERKKGDIKEEVDIVVQRR